MEWIARFPPGVRLIIDTVFPGEYRIGYHYKYMIYSPGFASYYPFDEAAQRCYEAFRNRFPVNEGDS